MRSLRWTFALLSVLLLLGGAATASAQCPRGATRALTDGGGERWDFNPSGTVVTGSDGAFEGMSTAYINGNRIEVTDFDPPVEARPDGRGYEFQLIPVAGVIMRRLVYVPPDRSWVRYIDILQYVDPDVPDESTVITYDLQTNTGYEDDVIFDEEVDYGEVVTTSDGDRTLEPGDRWFSYDNILVPVPDPDGPLTETAPRAFCQTHWHPDGTVEPMSMTNGTSYGCGGLFGVGGSRRGVTVRYNLTVTRTVRVAIMHFAVQGSRAEVNAACAELTTLVPAMYDDLDDDIREEIVNWQVPISEGRCDSIGDCEPGSFCTDGYCCNSPCGSSNPNDCQACSVAAGAAVNGTCAPVANGTTCRGATGECDRPERCDGVATTCPANLLFPTTTVCRAAASTCDLTEFCTGISVLCPTDRVASLGTVCRTGLGSCEPSVRCDGTTTICAEPFSFPDGAECDDGTSCTYSTCDDGLCRSTSGSCDDGDPCTTDSCSAMACSNTFMSGCSGGRDAGVGVDTGIATFDGGVWTDGGRVMDAGRPEFDEDAPGFDAPYDGPLPEEFDVDPDFDGGPFFDGGGPRRDGEVTMDTGFDGDADDHLVATGGGCICAVGSARSGTGPLIGLGLLALVLASRRR